MHRLSLTCSILVLTAFGCAKPEPPPPPPPGPPAVVEVTATDYAFAMPDTITSGPTTFHLVGGGARYHLRFSGWEGRPRPPPRPPGTPPPMV
jgi:hypothetical protein